MRSRLRNGILLSLLLVAGVLVWQWADKTVVRPTPPVAAAAAPATPKTKFVLSSTPGAGVLGQVATVNATNAAVARTNWMQYRLTNTAKTVGQLVRDDRAILLENALIDTAAGTSLTIPDSLRAHGDPGTYIVQARGAVDAAFRAHLEAAGATIVSYIPNNAYLVRADANAATALAQQADTQAVLPYEPYYKLKTELLAQAMTQTPLSEDSALSLLLFADAASATRTALEQLGATVVQEDPSPFGPVLQVQVPATALTAVAGLNGVQEVELLHRRMPANDLLRVTLAVTTNSLNTTSNYLNLTGSNVWVSVNDSGVDATHPDLVGRVFGDLLTDVNGHGTHVAGILAGNGAKSDTLTNVPGSLLLATNVDYRGIAPSATILSLGVNYGSPFVADSYLQEATARTNALISNNSWWVDADNGYGIMAASYDAATRDSLPEVTGSQPVTYVFAAGNNGIGNDNGLDGAADTITAPATSKNGIAVGAIEQYRAITNFYTVTNGTTITTNVPFLAMTDSSNEVASFSSRGNVGIGIEGDFGRFKPDVVAPGTFVVSDRSSQWDTNGYYNPTNEYSAVILDNLLSAGSRFDDFVFIPDNAVWWQISVTRLTSSDPVPPMRIYARGGGLPTIPGDFKGNNQATITFSSGQANQFWFYTIVNPNPTNVSFDVVLTVAVTNNDGSLQVLQTLNEGIAPYYRFESGTSMAAPGVSGLLALMQEFFTRYQPGGAATASPALYKALLINGARNVNRDLYDLGVQKGINYQGWGLVNLTNSLPLALTAANNNWSSPSSLVFFDQDPTNALVTGQSQTRYITLSTAAHKQQPLRVTLVWTDPPGNPAAGVKLVNDLDLVVTNLDTGDVYFGNDISAGGDYTLPWDTNVTANVDLINNVENIYLSPPLGSNYAVTVIGRRVNVNAVTAHPNDVAQDYALVISSGNGQVTNAITVGKYVAGTAVVVPNATNTIGDYPLVTATPLLFTNETSSGGILLHQHVGASSPLVGLNTVGAPATSPGVITLGETNQWHFYVYTNATTFTNVAFATFLPPTLAIPREGVFEQFNTANATRQDADIDLYVSTNASLTNLDAAVIATADKSLSRGGTEVITYSNSVANRIYYIGVKSEDREASEYGFLSVSSLFPFDQDDGKGNRILRGLPLPKVILNGTPANPGVSLVFGIGTYPTRVRRVIVTNVVEHQLFGDLFGSVSHNHQVAVLHNHTPGNGQFLQTLIYEDNGENDISNARHSDGPGSLRNFIGEDNTGLWLYQVVDNSPYQTGQVDQLTFKIEPQADTNGVISGNICAGNSRIYSVDVPPGATNLTVQLFNTSEPFEVDIWHGSPDDPGVGQYDQTNLFPILGGTLLVNLYSNPPLTPDRYYIKLVNEGVNCSDFSLKLDVEPKNGAVATVDVANIGTAPVLDDAVSKNVITVTDTNRIAAVNVGVLINHPRESDLTLTLVSPQGTRVLLAENRGGTDNNGYGKLVATTNISFTLSDFEVAGPGAYAVGDPVEDWTVKNDKVAVVQNSVTQPTLANSGQQAVKLQAGGITRTYVTTNGADCALRFAYRRVPTLDGLVGWWSGEGDTVDRSGFGNNGTLMGNAAYGSAQVGKGFVFDGNGDGVLLGNPTALQLQDFTIEAWVKRASTIRATMDPNFDHGTVLHYGSGGYGFNIFDDGHLSLTRVGVGAVDSTLFLNDTNSFHHVAVTKVGNAITFYLDGISQGAVSSLGNFTFNSPVAIGARGSDIAHSFYGAIDELAVFNRALSAVEIQSIYNIGLQGKDKCQMAVPPGVCFPFTGDYVVSRVTNYFTAVSTNWMTNTYLFQASNNLATVSFDALGGDSGLMIDTISLAQTNVVRSGYFVFTENTNLTTTPIKYFVPPFRSSPDNLVFSNGFEGVVSSNYVAGTFVGSSGWAVTSNFVGITTSTADSGTNALALGLGTISRTLLTVAGHTYRLTYAYRNANLNPIAWWPGNGNANDIIGTNNGTLLNGTSFAAGEYGQAFSFDGVNSNAVTFGNTVGNFGTNNFTVEFWISTTAGGEEAIFEKRPICSFCSMFSIRMGGPGVGSGRLGFEMYSDTAGNNAGSLVEPTLINDGMYHHAAFVRQGTNLNFYIDGSLDASGTTFGITSISNNADFKIGNSVCYPGDGTVPFAGKLDELTFFDQALSPVQIQAIYLAGAAGKCGTPIPPDICGVDNAQVVLSGISTNTISGGNGWSMANQTFTATGNTVLQFQGVNAGLLLDSVSLAEVNSDGVALPEESLSKLKGEVAYGDWTLEIWDNRAGAPAPADALEGWELQFVYDNTVPLTPGLENGQVQFFQVNVPNWALVATNTLISASGPVDVWFTTNNPPSLTNAGDLLLQAGAAAGYITNISVTGTPQLPAPGIYWLGVTNPNPIAVTGVKFQVDFNVTLLTNNAALAKDVILTNQTQDVTDPTRYFAFDVSSNATAVLFRLFDMTGNVDLVARRGAPLPTATSYDYASVNFGTNEDSIMVLSNSVPVPLAPGTWYLGVINADSVPVNYSIEAVEYTNIIINLTNTVPYQNTNSGVGSLVDYYHYAVTNDPAGRVQFEVNNPDGDVALVARKGLPLPDLSLYDYLSDNPGTNDELIVILTNSTPVALSPGDWFLGVVNNTGLPVAYTVKATEWPLSDVVTNGPTLVDGSFDGTNGFCLTWKSLVGAHYYVQGNAKLSLTNWATMSPTITATSNYTTWCISPLPAPDYFFFRVVDGLAINSTNAGLIISSIVVNTNGVLLGWNGPANAQYHVQWTPSIKPPPVWNTFSNIVTSPTNAFQFLDDGSQSGGVGGQTRFYRLKVP